MAATEPASLRAVRRPAEPSGRFHLGRPHFRAPRHDITRRGMGVRMQKVRDVRQRHGTPTEPGVRQSTNSSCEHMPSARGAGFVGTSAHTPDPDACGTDVGHVFSLCQVQMEGPLLTTAKSLPGLPLTPGSSFLRSPGPLVPSTATRLSPHHTLPADAAPHHFHPSAGTCLLCQYAGGTLHWLAAASLHCGSPWRVPSWQCHPHQGCPCNEALCIKLS